MSFVHNYLRAIGFSEISKKEFDDLIKDMIHSFHEQRIAADVRDVNFAEISRSFSEDIGISLRGEYDDNDEFHMQYYYPYFRGTGITSEEELAVERHAEKESYAGICEDIKVGVSLIFYLQNVAEFLNTRSPGKLALQDISVTLSGLSVAGHILLPMSKDKQHSKRQKKELMDRKYLMDAARQGDEDAMESLTMDDIDTYTMISKRIMTEDIFTIVDSYMMPYGIECDQYSILGEILDFIEVENSYTKEKIYILTVDVNDLEFDICINKKDLLGEPMIGRRFKGAIWLQGHINF